MTSEYHTSHDVRVARALARDGIKFLLFGAWYMWRIDTTNRDQGCAVEWDMKILLTGNDSCLLRNLIEAIRQGKEASCALKAHRQTEDLKTQKTRNILNIHVTVTAREMAVETVQFNFPYSEYKSLTHRGNYTKYKLCNDVEENPGPAMQHVDPNKTIKDPHKKGDVVF
ncbi:hypothetical protein pdam_00015101 [Pocillopora damicornis]|uniref:Uncharacterized protein n=1 Tax=Pocillopora damicornis TaxID=46731 RepID=A0A3M6UMP1_POCDA|nr:hypothetical protein pdam_00015101 [Pocillopora damicornis]